MLLPFYAPGKSPRYTLHMMMVGFHSPTDSLEKKYLLSLRDLARRFSVDYSLYRVSPRDSIYRNRGCFAMPWDAGKNVGSAV